MHKELFKTITDKLNFSLRHKTPVILQSEAAECGIACLAMVCGFYGLNIDLFNFRHRYGSPSQGVTLMSLSKTAEHAGLKSRALSLDLDEIKQMLVISGSHDPLLDEATDIMRRTWPGSGHRRRVPSAVRSKRSS